MKLSVYIDNEGLFWLEKLNLSPSELLKEAIEREKEHYLNYMKHLKGGFKENV